MKSAYELAMERMEAESGPTKKLTEDEKAKLAEINAKYDARVAEAKLSRDSKIGEALPEARDALQAEMSQELANLEEKREREISEVWDGE